MTNDEYIDHTWRCELLPNLRSQYYIDHTLAIVMYVRIYVRIGNVSRSVSFAKREVSVKASDGSVQLTLNLNRTIQCCSVSMLVKFENISANSKL